MQYSHQSRVTPAVGKSGSVFTVAPAWYGGVSYHTDLFAYRWRHRIRQILKVLIDVQSRTLQVPSLKDIVMIEVLLEAEQKS